MTVKPSVLNTDITGLIRLLQLKNKPIIIETHGHHLTFSFHGIYEVDRLLLTCVPIDDSSPIMNRIFIGSTLFHQVFDAIDTYIKDHHHTRYPSVHEILSKTLNPQ